MLTRENTDSALQRSKTTNRAAALPEPLPEADGRQQGVNKLTPRKGLAEMVETCKDCPECQTIKRGHQNNDTLQNVNKC